MPRYYLHVHGRHAAIDDEGISLPELTFAIQEAIQGIRGIVAEEALLGNIPAYEHVEITDEMGDRLCIVTFDDALKIHQVPYFRTTQQHEGSINLV